MLVARPAWSEFVKTTGNPDSSKILVLYYAATAVFVVLDFALGFNIRLASLETLPMARVAYYGVCFA
ncbi:MAG: hypothetical protein ACR2QI_06450, partial [Woeseiaceae bacterium]